MSNATWKPELDIDNNGVTNRMRANWADVALAAYRIEKVEKLLIDSSYDDEDVSDLIADLGHLCDREGIDFLAAIETAQMHHRFESDSECADSDPPKRLHEDEGG